MESEMVLVRTYQGKPAQMVAVAHAPGIIYASSPTVVERVKSGECGAVGFPEEDVFQFDLNAFQTLMSKWISGGCLPRAEWRELGLSKFQNKADPG